MNKEEMLEEVYKRAKAYELAGGNCSQCSLAAIFEVLGVDDENVVRAATGFADGVGLTGDGHCGALSGGTMAISGWGTEAGHPAFERDTPKAAHPSFEVS